MNTPPATPRGSVFRTLAARYTALALILTNSLVALLLLNAACRILREFRGQTRASASLALQQPLFPHLSPEKIQQLNNEFGSGLWSYAAWTGFENREHQSEFLNVSRVGFRLGARRDQTLDDPGTKVFVFGGSTTFGMGVADADTIPAHLQRALEERHPGRAWQVFNFGCPYYFSMQEAVLLRKLLARGIKPDIAIFIDGLNDLQTEPYFTPEMSRMFDDHVSRSNRPLLTWLQGTSLGRVAAKLRPGTGPRAAFATSTSTPAGCAASNREAREMVMQMASRHGFKAFFFIQPVPGWQNAYGKHAFMPEGIPPETEQKLHALMAMLEAGADGTTSHSLAALLRDFPRQPFVDEVHYSPEVCMLIARAVAARLPAGL